MDPIGWYIATMHQMLGHDKTAAFLGQQPGSKDDCLLCQYERNPDDAGRRAVITALSRRETT
jgi:hypothetical protein